METIKLLQPSKNSPNPNNLQDPFEQRQLMFCCATNLEPDSKDTED